jgi:hypothetical protein
MLWHMTVEEIPEAVAKLPPDQLARFRRWFIAFETGRTNHTAELDSTAIKLGRLAGRAFCSIEKARERALSKGLIQMVGREVRRPRAF